MDNHFDIVGIGFGPANLSQAIALEEGQSDLSVRFLEAQRNPVWQGGMMLDGSNIQNHPSRDPTSLPLALGRHGWIWSSVTAP